MNAFLWLLGGALLAAPSYHWHPTSPGRAVPAGAGISVVLPADWMYDDPRGGIVASRDGPLLELVHVALVAHADAFAAAHRPCGPELAPEDLAESYVANLQAADPQRTAVRVLETVPAEIAGQAGFRVHLRYRLPTESGSVEIEQVAVGAALPAGLLLATYEAPALHYFPAWLGAFETVLQSVRRAR